MNFKKFKETINNIDIKEDCEVTAYYTEDLIHLKNYEGEIILTIDLFNQTVTYRL